MRVTLAFDMSSAAFEDDPHQSLGHIWEQAQKKIREQLDRPASLCTAPEASDKLLDLNGNTIGHIQVHENDNRCQWCGVPGGH